MQHLSLNLFFTIIKTSLPIHFVLQAVSCYLDLWVTAWYRLFYNSRINRKVGLLLNINFWLLYYYFTCASKVCQNMRKSNFHAMNVIQNSVRRITSRNIKYQYIRKSNTHAINVTIKLVNKVASRYIKCPYMSKS